MMIVCWHDKVYTTWSSRYSYIHTSATAYPEELSRMYSIHAAYVQKSCRSGLVGISSHFPVRKVWLLWYHQATIRTTRAKSCGRIPDRLKQIERISALKYLMIPAWSTVQSVGSKWRSRISTVTSTRNVNLTLKHRRPLRKLNPMASRIKEAKSSPRSFRLLPQRSCVTARGILSTIAYWDLKLHLPKNMPRRRPNL